MTATEGPSSKSVYKAIPDQGHDGEQEIELPVATLSKPDLEDALKRNTQLRNGQDGFSANEVRLLQDGNVEELERMIDERKHLFRSQDISIEFYDLNFHTTVDTDRQIVTVSTVLWKLLTFWKPVPQKRVNILANATGRILPRKMTLLLGPPGSGKSVLLKALSNRLESAGKAQFSGDIYYDGDDIKSDKFLVGKVADYIEQGDTHQAVLTVDETLKFAWSCTTGGHHSYAVAKDEASAAILEKGNASFATVHNEIAILGLNKCKDTYVGNATIRGVSGGQKRRVTIGEMLVCPRPVKMMDCITNGLDTATAYDIVKAIKVTNLALGNTEVISLLQCMFSPQPPPDVYNLFDEVILLCEGHIIYHGPREKAMSYFNSLGYECPFDVDEADFLQELPTPEGRRFIAKSGAPHRPRDLARAWKSSDLYQQLLSEMRSTNAADAKVKSASNNKVWYEDYREKFPNNFWFYFTLCLEREFKVVIRDPAFFAARFGQSLFMGAIAGSLFNNIGKTETSTMNGFLFNSILFSGLGSFSILPVIYEQKAVFYKQKDSFFYPTMAFVFTQNIAVLPLQIVECAAYSIIVYWSAGLSQDYDGSRFLTFIVINLIFSIFMGQLFRVLSGCIEEMKTCIPVSGMAFVLMILFSGFIQPKSVISDGWIWFYWMNPISWALKALSINQFTSPRYNFFNLCK
eukprot:scaffold4964_cov248-Ochromonas_danica.AAC.6